MSDKQKNDRRVVVTGLGVVSSLGIGWEEFWKNLLAGKSGISKIESFNTAEYERVYGGEIKNFRPGEFLDQKTLHSHGRTSQLVVTAALLALKDSKLKINKTAKCAICIGTTTGEQTVIEDFVSDYVKHGFDNFKKKFISVSNSSSLAGSIACKLKLPAKNVVFSTACAAGNYALGYAYDLINAGRVDWALAGGADALSRLVYTGFQRLYAIAPERCQPFDKNRKGMIPGEGSGVLVLERLDDALKRNSKIYAEILGYGMSCDAEDMTKPSPSGIAKAITKCLKNSSLNKEDIDYINAHGTGTIENDKAESEAIRMVFGKRTAEIPVTSIKSMLGHTMGAAAALETISCCLTIQDNVIPPTINFIDKDSGCDLDVVVNTLRPCNARRILNNSQAFGGNNACLALAKVHENV